jgi:Lipid A core - O-antigen ligase and related enzymes
MKSYKFLLFTGLAAILIFSPIARGAVRLWSITPVLLVAYGLIFLWLFKVHNSRAGLNLPYKGFSNGKKGTKSEIASEKRDSPNHFGNGAFGTVPFFPGQSLLVPILLFATLAVSSFAFSIYKHDSFYALIRLSAYIGLYYLVVNEFGHGMRKRLVQLAIWIGAGLSAYGLLQYFGVFAHSWWAPSRFLAATYVNHNHFAGYLELVIPAAIAITLRRKNKLFVTAALIIMSAAFILTQSRGAWISLAVSLAVMAVMMIRKGSSGRKTMLVLTLVILAAASLLYFTKDTVSSRIGTFTDIREGEDSSAESRIKVWQGAAGMIKERPLTGFGIGDFDAGFYRYRPEGFNSRAVYTHNDYLQMASEMGVFAPFIMLWIFIAAIREGFRKKIRAPTR